MSKKLIDPHALPFIVDQTNQFVVTRGAFPQRPSTSPRAAWELLPRESLPLPILISIVAFRLT